MSENTQTIYQVNRGETWKDGTLRFVDYCREPYMSDACVIQDLKSLTRRNPGDVFRARVEYWGASPSKPDRIISLTN